MAVWEHNQRGVDADLVNGGFIKSFRSTEILKEAVDWLDANGYYVVALNAGKWATSADMSHDLCRLFGQPLRDVINWNAFFDYLSDVADGEPPWIEKQPSRGFVLVLLDFEKFQKRDPKSAFMIVDLFASAAVDGALLGNRMLCLLGVDTRSFSMPKVGGQSVHGAAGEAYGGKTGVREPWQRWSVDLYPRPDDE